MQIQARSRSASNTLATYFRQRIHPLIIGGLAVVLFVYGRPASGIDGVSIAWFAFILAFIILFRLYDDLLQVSNDIGKPDRNYTDPASRRTLSFYLIISLVFLHVFASVISWRLALLLFCFVIFNHLLYLLWVTNKIAAGFLPLFKYPFLYLALQLSGPSKENIGAAIVFPAIALFVAFVAFESMDDESFPIRKRYSGVLQASSFLFLLVGKVNGTVLLTGAALLTLSLLSGFLRMKGSPYLYLFCFLLFKLSIDNL